MSEREVVGYDERGPIYGSSIPSPSERFEQRHSESSRGSDRNDRPSTGSGSGSVGVPIVVVLLTCLYLGGVFEKRPLNTGPSETELSRASAILLSEREKSSSEQVEEATELLRSDEGVAQLMAADDSEAALNALAQVGYFNPAVERYIVQHLSALSKKDRSSLESYEARAACETFAALGQARSSEPTDILEQYIEGARYDDVDFPYVLKSLQTAYSGFRSTPGRERVGYALERRLRRHCLNFNAPAGFDSALAPRDLAFNQGFAVLYLPELRHAAELSKTLGVLRNDFRFEHTATLLQKEYERRSQGY